MQFEVSFQEEERYLLATVQGDYDPSAIIEALERLKEKTQQTKHSRIFIDAMNISPPKIEFYRFEVGVAFAERLPNSLQVALLSDPKWINKFMENTAVNRGANLRVFSDKAEALRWLLEE